MNRNLLAGLAGGLLFIVVTTAIVVLRMPVETPPGLGNKPAESDVYEPEAIPDQQPVLAGLTMRPVQTAPYEGKGEQIALEDLSAVSVGDRLSLFIPQEGRVHEGEVSDVSTTGAGNRVITGFVDGTHRFIFTVGEFQTFATIQTAAGRYQMETRGGSGRIISVATINAGLDFSQPDYVIPERKEPVQPMAGKPGEKETDG